MFFLTLLLSYFLQVTLTIVTECQRVLVLFFVFSSRTNFLQISQQISLIKH